MLIPYEEALYDQYIWITPEDAEADFLEEILDEASPASAAASASPE